jgi:hypothetical protein
LTNRGVHSFFGATINDHRGALTRQTRGDGQSDAGRRAGDQGSFVFQFKVHVFGYERRRRTPGGKRAMKKQN